MKRLHLLSNAHPLTENESKVRFYHRSARVGIFTAYNQCWSREKIEENLRADLAYLSKVTESLVKAERETRRCFAEKRLSKQETDMVVFYKIR